MSMAPPRLAFYGDDFTGATDTLATVAAGGLRAMLFLHPPTPAQREAAGELDCIGIAGAARSMGAAEMEQELDEAGRYFAQLGAAVFHYKTCSTFDSSPETGSIGAAARILRRHLRVSAFMPIVGGQPNLNRYCVFGNLFAAFRTGEGAYRLDRHPTMSRHPVTPMHEADLRLHLARQGMGSIAGVQYPSYDLPPAEFDALIDTIVGDGGGANASAAPVGAATVRVDGAVRIKSGAYASSDVRDSAQAADEARAADDARAVLFDIGHASHLPIVGRAIWTRACRQPLLAIGPSGVAQTLLAYWREADDPVMRAATTTIGVPSSGAQAQTRQPAASHAAGPGKIALARSQGPVFLMSGSMSPVTARQIAAARSYHHIPLDAQALASGDTARINAALAEVLAALSQRRHVLAYTSGPAQAAPGITSDLAQAAPGITSDPAQAASGIASDPAQAAPGIASGPAQAAPGIDIPATALAKACGAFLDRVLESARPRRVGVAGGDTSSLAVRHLDAWGLSCLGQLDPGVALCTLHSDRPWLDGVEIMLKGGQMGATDLFERLLGE